MLTMLIAAAAALIMPAERDDGRSHDRNAADALREMAEGCELEHEYGQTRGIDYRHEVRRYLDAMLKDPPACPGLAQKAARFVLDSVGNPERPDVDLAMLRRALDLVREGRVVRRDTVAEGRYARMLWLFAEHRPWRGRADEQWIGPERLGWREWSEGAQGVALLAARNQRPRLRTTRTLELEAEIRLRRDLPHYDPARAVRLYESGELLNSHAARQRVSKLLTDGAHLPRDYARAAQPYRYTGPLLGAVADEAQRELLTIGRQAAAAATTRAEQLVALDILFGATLTGDRQALIASGNLLSKLRPIPRGKLAAGDAERAGRAVDWDIGYGLGSSGLPVKSRLRPIGLDGLIGPDGRLVLAVNRRSSGDWRRDRIALGAWFYKGRQVDFSATAQGRLIWVQLPSIDPLLDSATAWRRWNR